MELPKIGENNNNNNNKINNNNNNNVLREPSYIQQDTLSSAQP